MPVVHVCTFPGCQYTACYQKFSNRTLYNFSLCINNTADYLWAQNFC